MAASPAISSLPPTSRACDCRRNKVRNNGGRPLATRCSRPLPRVTRPSFPEDFCAPFVDRALHSGRRLRQAGRGGARGRCGGRRLDPCRCDGRSFRAEYQHRAGRGEGDPPPHQEDARCTSDDRPVRSVSRGLCESWRRYHHGACRGRTASAPLAARDPRAWQESRRNAQSRHAGKHNRAGARSHRPHTGDVGQSRFRRAGLHSLCGGKDPPPARHGRGAADRPRSRRRHHRADRRDSSAGRRQCAGRRLRRIQGRQRRGLSRQHVCNPQRRAWRARGSRLMIPRYSRPEMATIWSPETRFRIWFEIEAHAADAMAELGIIPKEAAKTIWAKGRDAKFDIARIDAIEAEVKHDVIAFLTHLAEHVGPEARFVHSGMTSSDVLDTCFNIQLLRAADILVADVDRLLKALKKRAFEHKQTPTIGRSHGIHAEPTTFGVKLAVAYAEFSRARERLLAARKEVATCAISGAVGTFAQIDPRVEAHVAKAMGLAVEPVSTQIIPRDRHAMFFATLGVVASSMERLAIEIRHLQRTEVLEAEEFFSEGQKGSSAMPHKRNPVLSENITGLARMVRSYALPAMENVALWHERDISHSSVERMVGPDATVTLDFALNRLAGVIDKLLVYPENMRRNLDRLGGLHNSQRVLLALTQAGVSREDAYRLVQRNAMRVWRGEGDFLAFLKADSEVSSRLSDGELESMFDEGYHLKHVDTIFRRVFGAA